MSKNKTFIISLGGSIVIPKPNRVDVGFLKKFRQLILDFTNRGNCIVIITGGGKVNKMYNEAAQKIAKIKNIDLDWLGIAFTKANAELIRAIFGDKAHGEVITNPTKRIKTNKKIIIGCGWKPGCSSDKDAVLIAQTLGAKKIINLTNIDYVYTADPDKDKSARPIKQMSWSDYRQLIGGEWMPRLNTPFDPIASKLAQKLGLEVIIMNGLKVKNFKNFLIGKEFIGTIIRNSCNI